MGHGQARYAYRSIAAFVKHVTSDHGATDFDPFPRLPQSLDEMISEERAEFHRNLAKDKLSKDGASGKIPSPQQDPGEMVEVRLTEKAEHRHAEREAQESQQRSGVSPLDRGCTFLISSSCSLRISSENALTSTARSARWKPHIQRGACRSSLTK